MIELINFFYNCTNTLQICKISFLRNREYMKKLREEQFCCSSLNFIYLIKCDIYCENQNHLFVDNFFEIIPYVCFTVRV